MTDHEGCIPRLGRVEALHRQIVEAEAVLRAEYDPARQAALLATIADLWTLIDGELSDPWLVPAWVLDTVLRARRAATDAADGVEVRS